MEQNGKSLDERRYDLEKFKAEQELNLQLERVALERAKVHREAGFWHSPVLLPAAIAFATLVVSGVQIVTNFRSAETQVKVAELHEERQDCIAAANSALGYVQHSGASSGSYQWGLGLIETTCPQFAKQFAILSTTVLSAAVPQKPAGNGNMGNTQPQPGSVELAASNLNQQLSIVKKSPDDQVISFSSWKNFAVQIDDQSGRPVAGAKVAWRTPDMDPSYTYVGVTDAGGMSQATNLYTSSTLGSHQQTADLVEKDTPVGFTQWAKIKPTGKSVAFQFSFSSK